jgi:hypothetical protein
MVGGAAKQLIAGQFCRICNAVLAPGRADRYSAVMSAEGMYRKRDGWSDQHSVRVKYDGCVELEVPEKWYKEKGWRPLFDDLPWSDEAAAAVQATTAESTTPPDSAAGESASNGNKTESSETAPS